MIGSSNKFLAEYKLGWLFQKGCSPDPDEPPLSPSVVLCTFFFVLLEETKCHTYTKKQPKPSILIFLDRKWEAKSFGTRWWQAFPRCNQILISSFGSGTKSTCTMQNTGI
jgi:hypothetical protein